MGMWIRLVMRLRNSNDNATIELDGNLAAIEKQDFTGTTGNSQFSTAL